MWNSNLTGNLVFVLIKSGNSSSSSTLLPSCFFWPASVSNLHRRSYMSGSVFHKAGYLCRSMRPVLHFLACRVLRFCTQKTNGLGISLLFFPAGPLALLQGFGIGGSHNAFFNPVLFILWVDVRALRFWKFKFWLAFLSVHIFVWEIRKGS